MKELKRVFVATKGNLIPYDNLLPLVEAISTTVSNKVWRLKNFKNIRAEHAEFSPPVGVHHSHSIVISTFGLRHLHMTTLFVVLSPFFAVSFLTFAFFFLFY